VHKDSQSEESKSKPSSADCNAEHWIEGADAKPKSNESTRETDNTVQTTHQLVEHQSSCDWTVTKVKSADAPPQMMLILC